MTNMENDLPDGFETLPEAVQLRLRIDYERRIHSVRVAYRDDRDVLRARFDAEIDRIYADPMAYPYTTRVAEVDRLVERYHVDRGRMIVMRDAGLAVAESLFYSKAALASVKGDVS